METLRLLTSESTDPSEEPNNCRDMEMTNSVYLIVLKLFGVSILGDKFFMSIVAGVVPITSPATQLPGLKISKNLATSDHQDTTLFI
ncbi:hypothetical protein OGATHE_005294 [Ogataea polymorpha]|uniref:Uncharacterized protein n=1 Tax=Ogataea polymorpha TaxID=460523 RepID=A0A9P8NWM6_9ASCO|nr:hypothetical protein OGATHE_005294 [Ogataea polymorpha]